MFAAALLPLLPLLAPLQAASEARGDWVYYDYVGADGLLRGGRVRVADVGAAPEHGALEPASEGAGYVTLLDNGPPANRLDLVIVGDGYTAAELGAYGAHVAAIWPTVLAEPPFAEYATYVNVHKVDVVSAQSGVDHDPSFGVLKDTALDMQFWCNGVERLLCVNVGKALAQAAKAPQRDHVLAIANSTTYGGAGYTGNDLATLSGNNGASIEVAIHELGHSLGNLADEYDYDGPTTYAGPEPPEPNASTLSAPAMAAQLAKWHLWIGSGGVGTFQGAKYSKLGIYRPTFDSKMRNLGQPFHAVNAEQLVVRIYDAVDPIDAATAPGTYPAGVVLFVEPLQPVSHALLTTWRVDGVELAGHVATTLDTATLALAPGLHEVVARVVDPTPLVRDEALRAAHLSEERAWTIAVGDPAQLPVVTAVAGDGWISSAGPFAVSGGFLDGVTAARIGGASAPILAQAFDALVLGAPALPPGAHDLELDAPAGTALAPAAVTIGPALGATTTGVGGTLTVALDVGNETAALYTLAVAGTPLSPPLALSGIFHGLELHPAGALKVAATGAFQATAELVFQVPALPTLAGATLHLQALVQSFAIPFPQSFTNKGSVTF